LHASDALPFCYLHLLQKSAAVEGQIGDERICMLDNSAEKVLVGIQAPLLGFGGKVSENAVMAAAGSLE